ncbi:chromatin-remodeling ATPase INO80 isoform X2 [Nematostella vectensis]|uniref:chromatin-remodeling ATPase INO80 isoform X2 n=1 Tax=Nematostella vectensis TaxID=45351 RepID=UPI0020771C25|nr:chromatin-remodeling ATPase INO80 isoform X2 [Nematostella vectensis]
MSKTIVFLSITCCLIGFAQISDAVEGPWGDWGVCSSTCNGKQERMRVCIPSPGGDCSALEKQIRRCNTRACISNEALTAIIVFVLLLAAAGMLGAFLLLRKKLRGYKTRLSSQNSQDGYDQGMAENFYADVFDPQWSDDEDQSPYVSSGGQSTGQAVTPQGVPDNPKSHPPSVPNRDTETDYLEVRESENPDVDRSDKPKWSIYNYIPSRWFGTSRNYQIHHEQDGENRYAELQKPSEYIEMESQQASASSMSAWPHPNMPGPSGEKTGSTSPPEGHNDRYARLNKPSNGKFSYENPGYEAQGEHHYQELEHPSGDPLYAQLDARDDYESMSHYENPGMNNVSTHYENPGINNESTKSESNKAHHPQPPRPVKKESSSSMLMIFGIDEPVKPKSKEKKNKYLNVPELESSKSEKVMMEENTFKTQKEAFATINGDDDVKDLYPRPHKQLGEELRPDKEEHYRPWSVASKTPKASKADSATREQREEGVTTALPLEDQQKSIDKDGESSRAAAKEIEQVPEIERLVEAETEGVFKMESTSEMYTEEPDALPEGETDQIPAKEQKRKPFEDVPKEDFYQPWPFVKREKIPLTPDDKVSDETNKNTKLSSQQMEAESASPIIPGGYGNPEEKPDTEEDDSDDKLITKNDSDDKPIIAEGEPVDKPIAKKDSDDKPISEKSVIEKDDLKVCETPKSQNDSSESKACEKLVLPDSSVSDLLGQHQASNNPSTQDRQENKATGAPFPDSSISDLFDAPQTVRKSAIEDSPKITSENSTSDIPFPESSIVELLTDEPKAKKKASSGAGRGKKGSGKDDPHTAGMTAFF